ncbi:MAG: autotransporter outer membrane beta-barrel domain-containing protein [Saprospiraceae bacterium]|nr:porin [Candidatus Brachybacter algidus]MBK8746321.1 autotransporter outer membrane beta-barrel domain-containing protein [Candidatus Brachybacter algidus]
MFRSIYTAFFITIFILLSLSTNAQSMLDSIEEATVKSSHWYDKFIVSSYGVMNYNNYNWQLLPQKRNDIEFERAVLELSYRPSKKWSFNTELEIEAGGTGVAIEFDPLEEFGEYEYEVEKGGEIWLEQFNFKYDFSPNINISFGRLKVPFGLIGFLDEPTEYHTTNVSDMENTILPTHWTEYGVMLNGRFGKNWVWHAGIVNGLDGSAFNSANFIKRGNQRRFEATNVNDIAGVARLDYEFGYEKFIGISGYYGNTRNNRPKPDLQFDANLAMIEAHVVYELEPFEFSGIVLYGALQNSEAVSIANRNLSNNLNVKRTPVGKSAMGWSAEVAFEPFDLLKKHPNGELYFFLRVDSYDTQFSTQGLIFDNPRWDRKTYTGGINYMPNTWLVFKTQYARQYLGIVENKIQDTFSLGFGYYIK